MPSFFCAVSFLAGTLFCIGVPACSQLPAVPTKQVSNTTKVDGVTVDEAGKPIADVPIAIGPYEDTGTQIIFEAADHGKLLLPPYERRTISIDTDINDLWGN